MAPWGFLFIASQWLPNQTRSAQTQVIMIFFFNCCFYENRNKIAQPRCSFWLTHQRYRSCNWYLVNNPIYDWKSSFLSIIQFVVDWLEREKREERTSWSRKKNPEANKLTYHKSENWILIGVHFFSNAFTSGWACANKILLSKVEVQDHVPYQLHLSVFSEVGNYLNNQLKQIYPLLIAFHHL